MSDSWEMNTPIDQIPVTAASECIEKLRALVRYERKCRIDLEIGNRNLED